LLTFTGLSPYHDASRPPATAANTNNGSHTANARSCCKILSLLSARERIGSKGQCGNRIGWLSEGVVVTNDALARAGAWNPRRLQNMTLAIGPGTPASCVLLPNVADDDSSSEDDSSEDDDDEDENEMFQVDSEDENPGGAPGAAVAGDSNVDGEAKKEEEGSEKESENSEDAMELLPSDAEDGQEYHFDESGRLVRDHDNLGQDDNDSASAGAARQEAETEIARIVAVAASQEYHGEEAETDIARIARHCRHLGARITQSPGEEQEEAQEQEEQPRRSNTGRRSRWETGATNEEEDDSDNDDMRYGTEHVDDDDDDDDDDSDDDNNDNSSAIDDDSNDDGSAADVSARDRYNIRQVEQYIDHLESLHRRRERRASNLSSPAHQHGEEVQVARSMKHGGCINTVSWLDCGWRISTVSHEDASTSHSSNNNVSPHQTDGSLFAQPLAPTEYPTQLLTSGDDHLVKFWDVAQSMGSTSPLPGGSATITPFSSPMMPMRACSELVDTWKNHHGDSVSGSHSRYLPGIVHPLVTLATGHRGNVFHASPVPHSLGKVATCAADGYLRLLDVEVHSSSHPSSTTGNDASAIVISPEYSQAENGESDPAAFRFRNSLMNFSHHFLSANVGLVCSERGLLHFDLRLPARSQKRGSLVPELGGTGCKACFPWRLGSISSSDGDGGGDNVDEYLESSAYVFAGGSGMDVGLYDLRMTAGSSSNNSESNSQVVQKYRPRALKHKSSSVAVSGIDLSKDKRELLVSYESDHVYTFPIFGGRDHPTLEDIDGGGDYGGDNNDTKTTDNNQPVPELAAYGGHLNRLTFLKMAKYAGPNDEYICTGSDSGHAWIYEKQSSTVVSFIKADNSTCNGIQPHPTLPYFITYGIDSTAKLWRATTPVDNEVDDSDIGRFNYSKRVEYQKSIVTDQWKKARKGKEVDLDVDEDLPFFPDETNEDDNDDADHFLGVFTRSRFSQDTPFIGNDMMNLDGIVAKNYFTCARSMGMGDDEPVKSGIAAMKRRVSLIKLRHQADRLGLTFNSEMPWILKPKEHLVQNYLNNEEGKSGDMVSYGCLADLIPDNPSDWIPFDKLLANPPRPGGMQLNPKYEHYYLESSADRSVAPVARACPIKLEVDGAEEGADANNIIDKLDDEASKQPFSMQANERLIQSSEKLQEYDSSQAWDILYQTVSLLKEAGNEALKASLPFLAARRYDKAINYCSLAYLEFPVGSVDFLAEHQYVISKNSGYECRWNELLKTLIMIRLNLAMCFLKEEIDDTKGAITQANLSLKELKPFATEKGIVLTGKKLTKKRTDEPLDTYTESKALQAKAYFRLGSAQIAVQEYDDAVKTFEHSVDSTKEAGMMVDAAVMRKINEAKRGRKEKKERQRKKFKFMFSSKDMDDSKDSGVDD